MIPIANTLELEIFTNKPNTSSGVTEALPDIYQTIS